MSKETHMEALMKKQIGSACVFVFFLIFLLCTGGCAQPPAQKTAMPRNAAFVAVPLGTAGGLEEGNLSSYLLAQADSAEFVALDAGTLCAGLRKAVHRGSFGESLRNPETVLREHIKAYLISHAHLDHVAGLVICSSDDSPKPVIGLPETIDNIRDHLFNWKIWPNFGNEGNGVQIKKYAYVRLKPGQTYPVGQTQMTVTPFELSHSRGYLSTAFLIGANQKYVLCFGDTGPDEVENSTCMQTVWTAAAPLVREHKLSGIFLEASFPSDHPDSQLFGHMTPKWMMAELRNLAELADPEHPETALKGLKVVVTHIKPSLNPKNDMAAVIMRELTERNDLGVEFVLPEAGMEIVF